MRNIFCYLGAFVLAITLCSCSVEETHIKEGSEVAQTTESSNSFTTTVHTTLSAPTNLKPYLIKCPHQPLTVLKKLSHLKQLRRLSLLHVHIPHQQLPFCRQKPFLF